MTSADFAQPDITLILDVRGIIQKGAVSSVLSDEGVDRWLGLAWDETLGAVGGASVRRMVEDARSTGVSASHKVAQRFPSGLELAIEYTTHRLGGNAGFIAIGRNLQVVEEIRSDLIAAQQSTALDHRKRREVKQRRLGDPTTAADLFERLSDGFVLIDQDGVILRANQPFRDLVQATAEDATVGERLGRWLNRPGSDMSELLSNLRRDGVVRLFATTISSDSGSAVEVEISAAGSLTIKPKFIGVLLRRGKPALDQNAQVASLTPAVEPVDRASLRKLIESRIADFERACIKAAREQSETGRPNAKKSGGDGKNPNFRLH